MFLILVECLHVAWTLGEKNCRPKNNLSEEVGEQTGHVPAVLPQPRVMQQNLPRRKAASSLIYILNKETYDLTHR
jgi:hypothetical protein